MSDTDQIDSRIIAPLINAIIKDSHAEVRRAALRAVVRLPLPAEGWIAVGGIVYCLDLRPGEEWKPALEREIHKRQLFFLFWSEHAKASPWVDWEWRTALHDKGIDAIALRPLQPMDQAPPPAELMKFHAEDPIMIIRDYYARRAGAKT